MHQEKIHIPGPARRARPAAGAMLLLATACATFAAPGYHGPRSDHFDGRHFRNAEPFPVQPPLALIYWQLTREPGWWPDLSYPPAAPPPMRVGPGQLRVTFINHATVLIQMDGLNILTDPVWSERVGPLSWVGPRRHQPPGIRLDELPPIDVVLISHNHYDHMDIPTLRAITARFHPRIITGLGNPRYLTAEGMPDAEGIDWWQTVALDSAVRITGVPARHWSGRSLSDRMETLWMGFVIDGPAGRVYFAGDTGPSEVFEQIASRFAPLRLALLPIAPFLPRWYMGRKHESPRDAVAADSVLGATTAVAIHWGTFELGDDGMFEAPDSLAAALARSHACLRFWVLRNGEGRDVPPVGDGPTCAPAPPAPNGGGSRPSRPPAPAPGTPTRSRSDARPRAGSAADAGRGR